MDIHQLRISALRRLIGSASLKEFADQHDLDSSYLSQILNGHRNLGERAAATMESKIGCAAGALVAPALIQLSTEGDSIVSNVSPAVQPNRYYSFPVVSSVVAGGWGDAIQAYEPGAEDRFEKTDTKVKGPAFWLEVEGDSMTSLSGPSIPEGMLILVDTGIEPQPGHLVVAKLDTEEKSTFKKLVQDGGKLYLKPLNTGYNPIEINGNCRIIGVVREAKMKLL